MNQRQPGDKAGKPEAEDLVTERDVDEVFGLFQEESYPEALRNSEQSAAVRDALPQRSNDKK